MLVKFKRSEINFQHMALKMCVSMMMVFAHALTMCALTGYIRIITIVNNMPLYFSGI